MSTNEYGYNPQPPVVATPTMRTGIERELQGRDRARRVRNPISSAFIQLGAWSSRKSHEANAKRLAAQTAEIDSIIAMAEAPLTQNEIVMRLQVRNEMARYRHEFALQRESNLLHTDFQREKKLLHIEQRDALAAQHGVEAEVKFKNQNFRLGETRKEAQIAETAELVGRPTPSNSNSVAAKVESLFRIRGKLREASIDTTEVDDLINELGDGFSIAAE
jgi:hypothetical protein